MKYIIEHLEPELFEWCIIEYTHISSIVGKENLIITNIRKEDIEKISGIADVKSQPVGAMHLKNACILDPDAEKQLSPEDKFDYLIFGGILGDNPPKKRTKEELTIDGERRNLGKEQMATDNAVYVAKIILEGKTLGGIKFQDGIEIDIAEGESVMFPFRYVLINNKPLVCKELIKHLKEREEF